MSLLLAIPLRLALGAALASGPAARVHASAPQPAAVVQPAASTPATPEALDELYAHAQMQVESYNATGDVAKVRIAHEELSRWLVGHAKVYGYGEPATQARAPVQEQIAMLEQVLASHGTAAPATTPVAPTGPSMTAEQAERRRTYDKLTTWGIVSLSVGAGTLVLGALPAWLLRNNALSNAADESFYVEEQKYIERARRRQTVGYALLGIGCGLLGLGIASVAIGASGRARLRREMAVAPALGPGFAGGSATLRF